MMSNECSQAILEKYPKARPATEGVKVGDVICNHADVSLLILTEDIIKRFHYHKNYYVIGSVGGGYHFERDIKEK